MKSLQCDHEKCVATRGTDVTMNESLVGSSRSAVTKPVTRQALLNLVSVRPPYFALNDTELENGLFTATAEASLPQGLALGPMRPGDLSRHGAIAGSCALALQQKDAKRCYYLATEAVFTGFPSSAPYGTAVRFEALVAEQTKRQATVFVTASVEGAQVATLEVKYSVMQPLLFERLNSFRKQATPPQTTVASVTLGDVAWHENTGTYSIAHLPVEMCAGHFDNFPAAPVALLMDLLAQIAERFVDGPSFIAEGRVRASGLCWAGSEVMFSMTRKRGTLRETELEGFIASGGATVGEMQLKLRH